MVSLGTALGQGLLLASYPLLSRLYTSAEFGVFATFAAALSIIYVAANLRYELAIPLPASVGSAILLLKGCFRISLLISVLAAVGFTVIVLAGWLDINGLPLGFAASMLGAGVLFGGAIQSLTYWNIRRSNYFAIGLSKALQGGGTAALQVLGGLIVGGSMMLVVGHVGAMLIAAAIFLFYGSRFPARVENFRERVFPVLTRYKDFPRISSGSAIINSAGQQLPVILMAAFYGLDVAGLFGISQRLLSAPGAFLGRAISQVYFGEISTLRRESGDVRNRLIKLVRILFLWVFPISVSIAFMVSPVFRLLFSEYWYGAVDFIIWMIPAYAAQFVFSPISQTLNIFEKQFLQLLWDVGRLAVISSIIIGGSQLGWQPIAVVSGFSIAMVVLYGLHFFLCIFAATERERR